MSVARCSCYVVDIINIVVDSAVDATSWVLLRGDPSPHQGVSPAAHNQGARRLGSSARLSHLLLHLARLGRHIRMHRHWRRCSTGLDSTSRRRHISALVPSTQTVNRRKQPVRQSDSALNATVYSSTSSPKPPVCRVGRRQIITAFGLVFRWDQRLSPKLNLTAQIRSQSKAKINQFCWAKCHWLFTGHLLTSLCFFVYFSINICTYKSDYLPRGRLGRI